MSNKHPKPPAVGRNRLAADIYINALLPKLARGSSGLEAEKLAREAFVYADAFLNVGEVEGS